MIDTKLILLLQRRADFYYCKVEEMLSDNSAGLLLQSEAIITKYGGYYKVRKIITNHSIFAFLYTL